MTDKQIKDENSKLRSNAPDKNDLTLGAKYLLISIKEIIEFLGKHPLVTGILALLGIAGLILSIVGYTIDRNESRGTTEQIHGVKNKIDEIYKNIDIEHEQFSPNYEDIKYINMLPLINDTAYEQGRIGWDSGVTSKMIKGNFVLQEIYLDIAVQLARKYYPLGYFGKDPEEYFRNNVNQELAGYRTLSATLGEDNGSLDYALWRIETLSASHLGYVYLDKKIKEMVMHVSKNNHSLDYRKWESAWEDARQ